MHAGHLPLLRSPPTPSHSGAVVGREGELMEREESRGGKKEKSSAPHASFIAPTREEKKKKANSANLNRWKKLNQAEKLKLHPDWRYRPRRARLGSAHMLLDAS